MFNRDFNTLLWFIHLTDIYLLKVNNKNTRNTRTRFQICSKLIIKKKPCPSVSVVNFQLIIAGWRVKCLKYQNICSDVRTKSQVSLGLLTSTEDTFKGIRHLCVLKSSEYNENSITAATYFLGDIYVKYVQDGFLELF